MHNSLRKLLFVETSSVCYVGRRKEETGLLGYKLEFMFLWSSKARNSFRNFIKFHTSDKFHNTDYSKSVSHETSTALF